MRAGGHVMHNGIAKSTNKPDGFHMGASLGMQTAVRSF